MLKFSQYSVIIISTYSYDYNIPCEDNTICTRVRPEHRKTYFILWNIGKI